MSRRRRGGRHTEPKPRVVGAKWVDDDEAYRLASGCPCPVVIQAVGDVRIFTHLHEHGCSGLDEWRRRGRHR